MWSTVNIIIFMKILCAHVTSVPLSFYIIMVTRPEILIDIWFHIAQYPPHW